MLGKIKNKRLTIFLLLGIYCGVGLFFDNLIYADAADAAVAFGHLGIPTNAQNTYDEESGSNNDFVATNRGTFQGGAAYDTGAGSSYDNNLDSLEETQTTSEETNQESETVKKVQEELNDAGYECGSVDGIAGSKTQSAIQQYQEDKGLAATGIINDELLESLELNNLLMTDTKLSREIALCLYCIGKSKETIKQFVDFDSAEVSSDTTGVFYTFRNTDLSVYYEDVIGEGSEIWHFDEDSDLDRICVVFEHESDPNFIESAQCLEETIGPYEEVSDQEAGTAYYLWRSLQSAEIIEYYNFIGSDSSKDDGIMELTIEYCQKE